MPTPLEKFQSLLRALFQFEHADLDFGVYRIMNLRRERMEQWLNDDLPTRARAILTQGGSTVDDDLSNRLEAVKSQLLEMDPGGIDEDGNIVNENLKGIAKGKEYLKLKAQQDRAPIRTSVGMEPLVYNYLYDFFSRYYDTGDFIPKRRRSFAPDGRDTYAIPWDGEEVVLHWANKDQHYIKTGDRFTHYRWQSIAGGNTFNFEFRLTDADLPANYNRDATKKFNLLVAEKVEWHEDKATLILPFHYRGLTPEEERNLAGTQEAKLRESVIARTVTLLNEHPTVTAVQHLALAMMSPKRDAARRDVLDKNGNLVPLLSHHLRRWAVKNESDFFIHTDLRRFLSGELDYFLKSVVLNLDNLLAAGEQRAEPNFRLLDAVKRLGTEIVDFVSQLENFQKSLFEKKKFVLETSWCMTIDRIPASAKEEVYTAILANDWQWEEWEKLYKLSQWSPDFTVATPRTREFLDAHPYLMLDTGLKKPNGEAAYDSLGDRLISCIDGISQETDGTIINSENLQALRLIQQSYLNAFTSIYIDPPYNTEAAPIIYKNEFLHSSWLALVRDRVQLSLPLLERSGLFCVTIDDAEAFRLRAACDGVFGERELLGVACIKNNPAGRTGTVGFAVSHEYAFFYANPEYASIGRLEHSQKQIARYKEVDELGRFEWTNFRKHGGVNTYRTARPRQFYPIYVKGEEIRIPQMTWDDEKRDWDVHEEPQEGEETLWPIDSQERERIWDFGAATARSYLKHFLVRKDSVGATAIYRKWRINDDGLLPLTWWDKSLYSAAEYGTNLLTKLFGVAHTFSFPKSVHAVTDCLKVAGLKDPGESLALDYFAGSGTTGHAVINLNRADKGLRKYLLIEMGEYFNSVLKPRLQKVVFAENWKDGVPEPDARPKEPNNPCNGMSHLIKVLRLESYEDALDNIEFNGSAAPGNELGLEFRRDYELRYSLDWESKDCPTRLAVAQLDTPFDYTLTLRRESGTVTVKPDLPETFAYLIGLHTRRRFHIDRDSVSYLIYTGTLHEDGTEVAVLWRACRGWTDVKLKAEMNWWRDQQQTLAPRATRVYVNGASAIEGHYSLDAEFKTRMHGASV